ncbi:hypothetical protein DER30_3211 [Streptomyces sp. HB202]|nr:hypothetical protein DER30_3211 [Streptomyces sp. HB202]GGW14889.1 hypothetical protein GCM10010264_60850 [Streptomyces globisporus]
MSPYPSPLMSRGTGSAVAPAVDPESVVAATVIAAVAASAAKRLVRAVCPVMCVVPPPLSCCRMEVLSHKPSRCCHAGAL